MSKIKQLVPEDVNEFDELDYSNTDGILTNSQREIRNEKHNAEAL